MIKEKLGILIATDRFPPDYSGAGLRARRMIERMIEKYNQKFYVICIGKKSNNKKENETNKLNVKRINILKENTIAFPIFIIHTFLVVTRQIYKLKKNINLIHFFSFSWMNRMIMLSNILFFKKKTILEITLDGEDDLYNILRKGKKNKIFRQLTKYLLKRIDQFIVLSDYGLKTCLDFGIPLEKVWLRPNPCDENVFGKINLKEKNKLRKKLKLQNNFVLLNVGIIQPRKNQLFLAKVINLMKTKKIKLIIIGPHQKEFELYYNTLLDYINKNNLSDKIEIRSNATNINEYMIASDLFVFSSETEGFPNTIAEALVSGLPILMTDLKENGISKYISRINGVIIKHKEQEEHTIINFSSKLNSIYCKKIKFDRHKIRNESINKFSALKIDAEYMKIYNKLINKS